MSNTKKDKGEERSGCGFMLSMISGIACIGIGIGYKYGIDDAFLAMGAAFCFVVLMTIASNA